jgi:hypothetical protein
MTALIEALLALFGIHAWGGADPEPHLERVENAYLGGAAPPPLGALESYPLADWDSLEGLRQVSLDPLGALEELGLEDHLIEWLETAEGWGLL